MAAVIVPLALLIIVWAVWPRANPGARLAAIGGILFAIWAMIAVSDLATAEAIAAWVAGGIGGDIHAVETLIPLL